MAKIKQAIKLQSLRVNTESQSLKPAACTVLHTLAYTGPTDTHTWYRSYESVGVRSRAGFTVCV